MEFRVQFHKFQQIEQKAGTEEEILKGPNCKI